MYYCTEKKIGVGFDMSDRTIPLSVLTPVSHHITASKLNYTKLQFTKSRNYRTECVPPEDDPEIR
jgi:hypothetical protein